MPRPLPDRAASFVREIRSFTDEHIVPLERELGAHGFVALVPKLEALRSKAKERGLWAPFLPKDLGGQGLTLLEYAHVSEALGRSPVAHYVFNCQAPDVGNMELLHMFGTDAQKERFLGPLTRGETRSSFGMTEPEHAGSNPVWLSTRARKDGDDYVIDGHKWFTSSFEGSAFCIVMAVTEPDAPMHARASQIIVPTDTPGLRFVRNLPVMGEAGGGWASHAEIVLEGVRVPQSNRIGPEGSGFLLAQERLGPGRIHHAMRWIGVAERCFELMCTRAATRELSPGKPLGTKDTIQGWIADSRAEIDASRLLVLDAAEQMDREGAAASRDAISIVKFYVAGMLDRVMDRALQTHGGLGMLDDTPIAWWYRHERAARIYDGPDEVHKSSLAKRILSRHGMKKRD
ncbi:MAG: acyl-CoA dehydrogenase family protein [Deltaproteobacteria bacterium]|nr:acyl-CoA dehydrogenase family protein [Deltaproteobacteria bacterium]